MIALIASGACSSSNNEPMDELPPPTDATVDPDGEEVEVPMEGGSTAIAAPEGAVDEDTEIQIQVVDEEEIAPLEGEASMPIAPVAFTPHGTTFNVPVEISFTVEGGVAEGAVIARLEDENDTTWEVLDTVIEGDRISTEVTSFSIYAVVEGLCPTTDPDSDSDGACDSVDPCPTDATDADGDNDGVCDVDDACPLDANDDSDNDGVCDSLDPCPADATNTDSDSDGVCDVDDACPLDANDDSDNDGLCDSDDACPTDATNTDTDSDGVCDVDDACPLDFNDDSDSDGLCDSDDPCPTDSTNTDSDSDGVCDVDDICPQSSPDDSDGNGTCDNEEARITGTVRDGAGSPIIGIQVDLYDVMQNSFGSVTTDASGVFFFGNLPAGDYQAYVSDTVNCIYGSTGEVLVAIGELANRDINAGCF